jgi:hypothetical protein
MAKPIWPWIGLFGLALMPLVHDVAIEKTFSADGAYYFMSLLEDQRFTDFAWARNHSIYLTQWPVIAALRAGVSDWRALETLFGSGLLFPHVLAFAMCMIALRGQPKWPLLFPILSLLTVTVPSDYMLIGEHHVLVAFAWPILFFAIRPVPFAKWEAAVVAALTVAITRMYESAAFIAPVLAFFFMARNVRAPGERWAHRLPALVCLVAAAIALVAIVNPRSQHNRALFLLALVDPFANGQFIIAFAFLTPFLVALLVNRDRLGLTAVVVMVVFIVPAYALANTSSRWLGSRADVSFSCRTLSMTLIPPLLLVAAMLVRRRAGLELSPVQFRAFTVFVIAAVAFSLVDSRDWTEYRRQFKTTLETHEGFVPLTETPMKDHPSGWGWNNAILSYLWSDGRVRTIVLNPPDVPWEPFNPREKAILLRYIPRPEFLPY